MGVLKNLQNLSDLEFYKCAEKLQDDITDFCLRNFGLKKSPRNVNQIIKDISEEDQSEINKIFEKYGKTPNQQYASEYPEWFIDNRKRRLLSYTDDLIDFIIEANTIYPTTLRECDDRVIKLLTELVATFGEDNKGVGIGSQISQVIGIYYPTPIDNYCKVVKACKFCGRYMDDTYIIHLDKKFLRELLNDIKAICDRLGIVINKKKTQIVKLSNGFTFLKIRYFYGEHGAIIKIPCRKTITRERRKLRKLRGRLEAGKITAAEIKEQYKSWRGNIIKYKAYKSVRSCDVLYKSLYGGTYGKGENGKRRG